MPAPSRRQHVGSLTTAHGLSSCGAQTPERAGSVVAAHGLRCPQGMWGPSNRIKVGTCISSHCKADSEPPGPEGSPVKGLICEYAAYSGRYLIKNHF